MIFKYPTDGSYWSDEQFAPEIVDAMTSICATMAGKGATDEEIAEEISRMLEQRRRRRLN